MAIMVSADCGRRVLLEILPLFEAYLVSHRGRSETDPFRSFSANFHSDLDHLRRTLTNYETAFTKDDNGELQRILLKILGLFDEFVDLDVSDKQQPEIDAVCTIILVPGPRLERRLTHCSQKALPEPLPILP